MKPVLAADDVKISGFKYPGQIIDNNTDIAGLLNSPGLNVLTFIFFIVGLIFLFNILIAAYEYITASGAPQAIQAATKRLTNSLFGIIIVIASYVIIRIIGGIIGLNDII